MNLRNLISIAILCLMAAIPPSAAASTDPTSNSNLPELQQARKLTAAANVTGNDSAISQPTFDASSWYEVKQMPLTVLQVLEDPGVYKNLYFAKNLTTPGDLGSKTGGIAQHSLPPQAAMSTL